MSGSPKRPQKIEKAGKRSLNTFRLSGKKTANIQDKQACGPYYLIELIGKGAYGSVFKGLHQVKGNFVAVKKISTKQATSEDPVNRLMMEIKLLQRLRHPNIVRYIDYVEFSDSLFIVMEFMEIGSLSRMIKKYGIFPESLANVYIKQILQGLHYLHQQGVIHRDIKSENILLSTEGTVKVADFGVAAQLDDLRFSADQIEYISGTPYWMAPEVIQMQGISTACDIWSLGCTMIELLTGNPPYASLIQAQAIYKIVEDPHPPLPDAISEKLKDLLVRCFQKDANLRIDAATMLNHPWIRNVQQPETQVIDITKELSKYNEQLQEVDRKAEKAAYPTLRGPRRRQTRSNTISRVENPRKIRGHARSESSNSSSSDQESRSPSPSSKFQDFRSSVSIRDPQEQLPTSSSFISSLSKDSLSIGFSSDRNLSKWVENEEEDILDGLEISEVGDFILELKTFETRWDAEIEETFDESFVSTEEILEGKYQDRVVKDIVSQIETLTMIDDPATVINTCDQMRHTIRHVPRYKGLIITKHGILPIFGQLSTQADESVLTAILTLLNFLANFKELLDAMCLLGAIPVITAFSSESYSKHIRLEVMKFVGRVCSSSSTLSMFIACRGFPILVTLLEPRYEEYKEIVHSCLDSILTIFQLQTNIPKNEFCILFSKAGLLNRLATSLTNITSISPCHDIQQYFLKLSHTFRFLSMADSQLVIEEFHRISVLKKIKDLLCTLLPPEGTEIPPIMREGFLNMLKTVKNIATVSKNCDSLEEAGLLEVLVEILKQKTGFSKIREIHNQALNALFYISQFDRLRQHRMALAGIIPSLKHIITEHDQEHQKAEGISPMKEKALVLFLNLLHASPETRELMWKHSCLDVYIELLENDVWFVDSVENINSWVVYDPEKMELALLKEENIHSLTNLFARHSKKKTFSKVLHPFSNILQALPSLSKKMTSPSHEDFVPQILETLKTIQESYCRVLLLKILNALFESSDFRLEIFSKYRLYPQVRDLADEEEKVVVTQMANQLLQNFTKLSKRTF